MFHHKPLHMLSTLLFFAPVVPQEYCYPRIFFSSQKQPTLAHSEPTKQQKAKQKTRKKKTRKKIKKKTRKKIKKKGKSGTTKRGSKKA